MIQADKIAKKVQEIQKLHKSGITIEVLPVLMTAMLLLVGYCGACNSDLASRNERNFAVFD